MVLHCPTCHAAVEAGPLPPGSTASCPYCRALFQVPENAELPPQPASDDSPSSDGLASVFTSTAMFLIVFAIVGSGSGYLVYRLAESQGARAPAAAGPTSADASEADLVAAWRKVGHWTGTGQIRTPPFRTSSPRIRLHWTATPRDAQNPDNFALHLTDGSGKQLHTPVSIVGAGRDTAYLSTRPGRYVLEVFTFETDWEVTLEEPE